MEEDDDDFYGRELSNEPNDDTFIKNDEDMDSGAAEDQGEDEEEDSDDDVQFTLEKPEGAKEELPTSARKRAGSVEAATNTDRQPKHSTPIKQESQRPGSTAPIASTKDILTYHGKEGKDFPEIRTSKIDVNNMPVWPGTEKPITEIDIDADLAEHSKPWRQPGVDQTDFFNYGFDEYTWAQYCVRQQTMASNINEAKDADAQMKSFLGGGAGATGGMPGMPGMPDMDAQMAQMMQQSMAGGGMPSFDQFMQMMGQGGGMPNQPGSGPGFGGGFGQSGDSPHPQAGQGFQPPSGPAAGAQGGMGLPEGMDGYSAQQIAIMQQQGGMGGQGGGGGGGGGRRGGRNRGRGYY